MEPDTGGNEINPMIIEIARMVTEGKTDSEIGAIIGKHKCVIYKYRRKYGISAGSKYRSKAGRATKSAQYKTVSQFKPLNQLYL